MDETRTSGLVIPSRTEVGAALRGSLSDSGLVRGSSSVPAPAVRDWTAAEAREVLRLTGRPTAWVTESVGDPLVFAENERRKIMAVLGDLSALDLMWNRTLLAVWRAPTAKTVIRDDGSHGKVFRPDASQDEDGWQGMVALVVRMGPSAFVRAYAKELVFNEDGSPAMGRDGFQKEVVQLDESGNPVPLMHQQAPQVGDWVVFQRGYGTRWKINDYPCILVDKETEAIKARLPWPHAIDIT